MRITFTAAWQATARSCASIAAVAVLLGVSAGAASAQCVGDCSNDNEVTVDEIVTMVNLALSGDDVSVCAAGDSDSSGTITVDEIITAVTNALEGCPPITGGACGDGNTDAGEQCDDGGVCIGGSTAGTACTSDEQCGLSEDGVCVGGPDAFRGCASDDDCTGGSCVRCKTFGGDGCAANCTNESVVDLALEPGVLPTNPAFSGGNCVGGDNAGMACSGDLDCLSTVITQPGFCLTGSTAAVFGPFISLPLDLTGSVKLTLGTAGDDGIIPLTMRAADVDLPQIPVSSIACACVRGAAASTCGGVTFYRDGSQATNCTPGFDEEETCPAELPCAPVHGAGNTGSGVIGCQGLSPNTVNFELDCNGVPNQDPLDPVITLADEGPAGSAFMVLSAAIGTVVGACTGTSADYGPDGMFCTADDPLSNRGAPNTVPFVTGSATGLALNVADFPDDNVGPHETLGAGFTCNPDGTVTDTAGIDLAGVFASCDQPTINDIVVPINFVSQ